MSKVKPNNRFKDVVDFEALGAATRQRLAAKAEIVEHEADLQRRNKLAATLVDWYQSEMDAKVEYLGQRTYSLGHEAAQRLKERLELDGSDDIDTSRLRLQMIQTRVTESSLDKTARITIGWMMPSNLPDQSDKLDPILTFDAERISLDRDTVQSRTGLKLVNGPAIGLDTPEYDFIQEVTEAFIVESFLDQSSQP